MSSEKLPVGTVRADGMVLHRYRIWHAGETPRAWWTTLEIHERAKQKHRDRAIARQKAIQDDPEKRARRNKNYQLWQYNLTSEQYDNMLYRQDFKCAICKTLFGTEKTTKPHVDHCHKTNRVRGLLCGGCNTGIGLLKENPEVLRNAITYIE